jgi:hypothetical protein
MSLRVAFVSASFMVLGAACGGGGGTDVASQPAAAAPPPSGPSPQTPPPATSASGDLIWGVNGHPFTAYPDISIEDQVRLVVELGASQYRINMSGGTTPQQLDSVVSYAASRGVQVLPILQPPVSLDADSAEVIYRKSYDYAFGYAAYFKGRMPVWEIGNEMENYAIIKPCEMRDDGTQYPCEWGPAGGVGPLEYYGPRWAKVSAALKGMSDAVQQADPGALKAMGTAGWGHTGAFDRMQADGIRWDISVWHDYDKDNGWAMEKLARFGKPIWITEFNHPYGSRDGETAQAEGLAERINRYRTYREKYNVTAAHVYELLDEPYWNDFEAIMGLYKVERNSAGRWAPTGPKQAYTRMRDLIAKRS